VTDRFFFRIDGRALQRVGVAPDVAIAGAQRVTERDDPHALSSQDVTPAEPAARTPIDAMLIDRMRAQSAGRNADGDSEHAARSIAVAYLNAVSAR
jgi:hypothetical protein